MGDVGTIIASIASSSIIVWEKLPLQTGMAGGTNPSGDRQAKLDVLSNEIFSRSLTKSGVVAEVASEEMDRPMAGDGLLHVAMDPLDGSSNLETNNPLGSIFGVYRSKLPASGSELIASAFVSYGPVVTVTFALRGGVHRFVAIRHGDEYAFELQDSGIKLPDRPEVYGFGALRRDWIPPVKRFVEGLETKGVRLRYCGTFVGDYNQVLKHGGIFGYPTTKSKPRGKLRLLYEAAPMAFITKEAGGYSTDGFKDILSLVPNELSETTPVYLGSYSVVKELENMISSS